MSATVIALTTAVMAVLPADSIYRGTADELTVDAPYLEAPRIDIDGRLDEPDWASAAVLTDFTQYDPVEGIPATQRTETMVLVSSDALYVAVRAFDSDPQGIRASIAPRDNVVRRDDFIRVTLDTFNDQRRAYVFVVNPFGVQQDGIWTEGGGGRRGGFGPPIDYNPNFIWESNGRVEEWGYQVEFKIPFKSLKFPTADVQAWGFQVMRRLERYGYEASWAPISQDQTNHLAQAGQLRDLRGLDAGVLLEMNPVFTGTRQGEADELGLLAHSDPTGEFGLNATYGLTSNLTLDATYNPDFSQVEADAGQIAVNERFALFFPERRPFFLEGTDIFALPQQLVYTRSIANPIGGAKVTGKIGDVGVGYLGAYDDISSGGETDYARVNLLRARKDIGGSSTVGAVMTDRTASSTDFNRLVGADARLVMASRYTLTLLGALSSTRHDSNVGSAAGQLWSARFERTGREFSWNVGIEDSSHDFEAGSGFLRRTGDTQMNSRVAWNWYGAPGSTLERLGPSLQFRGVWDHDTFWNGGAWEEAELELGGSISFRGNTTIFGNFQRSGFRFPDTSYEGLRVSPEPGQTTGTSFIPADDAFRGMNQVRLNLFMGRWQRLRGRIGGTWSETPIFVGRSPVEAATSWSTENNLSIFPNPSLSIELNFRHSTLFRKSTGERYSTAQVARVRGQYQLTKALFIRGIAERSTADVSDVRTPLGQRLERCDSDGGCSPIEGGEGRDLYLEGLLSYEPSPGTVFFLGYSRSLDDEVLPEIRDLRTRADGVFVKLSYRYRF